MKSIELGAGVLDDLGPTADLGSDELAELLTDQDIETLRHRVNEGMGENTLRALTSDLAWLFGAGFAPVAALLLSMYFGLASSGAYLLSGAICTLLALWANRELGRSIE